MNTKLLKYIEKLEALPLANDRAEMLAPLISWIQQQVDERKPIRLIFVCTHNSRRSHLTQIWAQTMAYYHKLPQVHCYSAGTEVTALFPMVASTLFNAGFLVDKISKSENPIYSIKHTPNEPAIIGFSKTIDSPFNPASDYAAVMTCSHADENCPVLLGATKRIPVTYEDPKSSDNTPMQAQTYEERSAQIAREMLHVFSSISH